MSLVIRFAYPLLTLSEIECYLALLNYKAFPSLKTYVKPIKDLKE